MLRRKRPRFIGSWLAVELGSRGAGTNDFGGRLRGAIYHIRSGARPAGHAQDTIRFQKSGVLPLPP